ncbi:PEP-CTERM sorting domain-containing protein [uncultured Roseobacter sp.]|uniref:PEP-CTERM sorting domain-containing protein n=1 Tax=uncultured Roseobacter sp. TaxID=114847 RepID=UPI00261805FA|nr:PEP-CTERM sorting domain-containing protein [uncultured Roseobacter sp.]
MFTRVLATAAVVALSSMAAHAATFDFDADATAFFNSSVDNVGGKKFEGTFDQVYGDSARAVDAGTSGKDTSMGITVAASSLTGTHPFMDARNAGLGVCSSGTFGAGISQCSSNVGTTPGDDNLVSPEELTLSFSTSVKLTALQIRDAGHNLISNVVGALLIDGVAFDTGDNGMVILDALGSSRDFDFTSIGSAKGQEIYLSVASVEAVPVPASLPLLAGGMGLMGWYARRRKNAA